MLTNWSRPAVAPWGNCACAMRCESTSAELHALGPGLEPVDVGIDLRPVGAPAKGTVPDEHRADHHVGRGEPRTEEIGAFAQFALHRVFGLLEVGPAARAVVAAHSQHAVA